MASAKSTGKRAKSQPKWLVGTDELCEIMGVSKMHISRLVEDGMPKIGRGQFDAVVCLRWDNERLHRAVQRKATESSDGKVRNLMDERARLTAAQADAAEMDRDERRGTLIPLDVHEQELASWAHTVKQLVLGLSARLVPKLEGQPRDKLRGTLDAALKGCLVDVSRSRTALPGPAPKRKRKS